MQLVYSLPVNETLRLEGPPLLKPRFLPSTATAAIVSNAVASACQAAVTFFQYYPVL